MAVRRVCRGRGILTTVQCRAVCRNLRGMVPGSRTWCRVAVFTVTVTVLTLYPRRGFRLANSLRARASVRALLLAPWASGVAPGLIWTARAPATIVIE